jgi:hypothetical protein
MKKIFALVMVLGVIGSVMVGCGAPAAEGGETKPAETAGATGEKTE